MPAVLKQRYSKPRFSHCVCILSQLVVVFLKLFSILEERALLEHVTEMRLTSNNFNLVIHTSLPSYFPSDSWHCAQSFTPHSSSNKDIRQTQLQRTDESNLGRDNI